MTTGAARPAALGLAIVAVVLLVIGTPGEATVSLRSGARAQVASLGLVAQTPVVAPGGTFDLQIAVDAAPADAVLEVVLHQRVRSRSELVASMEGNSLRSQVYSEETPVSELVPTTDGSRRISLSFDPAADGSIDLPSPGVYPLEVIVTDAGGSTADSLVTHVIVAPAEGDGSPPLSVGVLAHLGAPPALQPEGGIELDPDDIEAQLGLAQALAAVPGAGLTLAVVPETLDALAGSGSDGDLALLDAIRVAAVDRSVLARPFVDVSAEALAATGLTDLLARQLDRGRQVLADVLDVEPDDATWLAERDLGADGLAGLEALGIEHVVVDPEQVEALRTPPRLSVAQPFLLSPPDEDDDPSAVDALARDPLIEEQLSAHEPAATLAHRVLAQLATMWFEQPGIERAVVVPIDGSVPPAAVEVLLQGIRSELLFRPTSLSQLFELAEPLLDGGDSRLARALDPQDEAPGLTRSHAQSIRGAGGELDTLRGLLGEDSPRTAAAADHLLLAAATELPASERRHHVEAARAALAEVAEGIAVTGRTTITLTAREGTVPLTLTNDTGVPVDVVIRLRSSRLDFPDGEDIQRTLEGATTRLDIAVEARASGAFPLQVEVRSPDGRVQLAATSYTVRSTAVAGAGLLLSIGAGLFLVVWWARHWRQARRSHRLVAPSHLAKDPAKK
jgi:hypothetical protein